MKPWRPPASAATNAIAGLCVVLLLVPMLMGVSHPLAMQWGLVPARITGEVIGLPGPPPLITLVSHMFLHGGIVHLLMNMVFLVWVGRQVEWLLGPFQFLLLFLLGGIAGGVAQLLFDPGSTIPVVGASGAISAVFATYALLFARSDESPARVLGITLSAETVRALRYAVLWIGLQLLVAVAFNRPGEPGIAVWAHAGGFLAGLLFGLPRVWSRDRNG
ncbi:rhomboid family intramembrane serine protease [Thermaurantiacus sp.]